MPIAIKYFLVFLIGSISSFAMALPSLKVTNFLKIIDIPSSEPHKIHHTPTPLAGGLALFSGLAILHLVFKNQTQDLINNYAVSAVILVFLTGLIDDKYILKPQQKIIGQLFSSILLVLGGYHTNIFLNNPMIDVIISIIWFLGIINAFNFMDSSDGLILEIGIVITGALFVFSFLSNQPEIQFFSISFLGLLVGLLYFNVSPAKLFMGDSGSQMIGMILAVLSILYNPLGHDQTSSWITPILIMSVPIFDVSLVVISRIHRNVAIYSGGIDHSFHRLIHLGFSNLKANMTILSFVLFSNVVAYFLLKVDRIIAYIIFAMAILTGAFLINFFEKSGLSSD